jgi:hypothetical protein
MKASTCWRNGAANAPISAGARVVISEPFPIGYYLRSMTATRLSNMGSGLDDVSIGKVALGAQRGCGGELPLAVSRSISSMAKRRPTADIAVYFSNGYPFTAIFEPAFCETLSP